MKAYLDYNIFTSIEAKELSFIDLALLNPSIKDFPYSAAHIQEADNITGRTESEKNNFILSKLATILVVSGGSYIFHDYEENKIHFLEEDPMVVLETIREVPFGKTAMKMFTNLLSPKQKLEVRESLGIESSKLNNYTPKEVIAHLDTKLVTWNTNSSFLELIDKAMSYYNGDITYGLHNKIAGVYELLDLFGYWRDKETETSNYARLWDASHAFYASHCDYFISDDKRNRNKAQVVYDLFAIKTKVISSKEKV